MLAYPCEHAARVCAQNLLASAICVQALLNPFCVQQHKPSAQAVRNNNSHNYWSSLSDQSGNDHDAMSDPSYPDYEAIADDVDTKVENEGLLRTTISIASSCDGDADEAKAGIPAPVVQTCAVFATSAQQMSEPDAEASKVQMIVESADSSSDADNSDFQKLTLGHRRKSAKSATTVNRPHKLKRRRPKILAAAKKSPNKTLRKIGKTSAAGSEQHFANPNLTDSDGGTKDQVYSSSHCPWCECPQAGLTGPCCPQAETYWRSVFGVFLTPARYMTHRTPSEIKKQCHLIANQQQQCSIRTGRGATKTHFHLCCDASGKNASCQWRLNFYAVKNVGYLAVPPDHGRSKSRGASTCLIHYGGLRDTGCHPVCRVAPAALREKIESELPHAPALKSMTVKESVVWIQNALGLKVSKSTAHRAAQAQTTDAEYDDFELLDSVLNNIQEQLPGSVCKSEWIPPVDDEAGDSPCPTGKHFFRACVVPRLSVEMAQSEGLDVAQMDCGHISGGMLHKFVLCAVVTRNTSGRVLPLCFAVLPSEKSEHMEWMLQIALQAGLDGPMLQRAEGQGAFVMLRDFGKAMKRAIRTMLPLCVDRGCMQHLQRLIRKHFGPKEWSKTCTIIWAAVLAVRQSDCDYWMNILSRISPRVCMFITIGPIKKL
jgi:hypothetical protein